MPDPLSLSVRAAAQEIAAGRLSAEALTRACLDRIAAREGLVGAWHYLDPEAALAAARQRDAEPPRGPLHGIPLAVKDLIDTADMSTGYGSPTANPHNPAHTPGGSSSGSAAAVADGMVRLGFGSQTAGSTIRPAAYCGCVGYKPSFGTIARAGVKALADSLDTIGVMACSVDDAAFFTGIIAGRPALRDIAMPGAAPRFGLYRTPMWGEAEPSTIAALDRARAALGKAGAWIAEIVVPPEHQNLTAAHDTIMGFELVRGLAYERIYRSAELSPRLAQLLDQGMTVGAEAYDAAIAETAAARARLEAFFGPCDAMLVPAAPGEAPPGLGYTGDPVFSRMWTLLGVPCLTLPALWGDSGLPAGVQLVGRVGTDARLMEAGLFLEHALAETA